MPKFPVPQTLDECPHVARYAARHAELTAELQTLDQQFNQIESGIANTVPSNAIDDAAREVLADGVKAIRGVTDLYQQRDTVQQKLRIIRKAIELNRKDLETARATA